MEMFSALLALCEGNPLATNVVYINILINILAFPCHIVSSIGLYSKGIYGYVYSSASDVLLKDI